MKKVVLPLLVIAASGAYVLPQSRAVPPNVVIGSAIPTDNSTTGSVPVRTAVAIPD